MSEASTQDISERLEADPANQLTRKFLAMVKARPVGSALELGSRNVTGYLRRDWIPADWKYTGFDIEAGENVDIVGDAHELTKYTGRRKYDVIFAVSVFEHLLMPWKVVVELNRALKPGGLIFVVTHQTWPLHVAPTDYYRYSSDAWPGLFNRYTGFEIVEAAMGEPAIISAVLQHGPTIGMEKYPGYLASSVIARKIGRAKVSWRAKV